MQVSLHASHPYAPNNIEDTWLFQAIGTWFELFDDATEVVEHTEDHDIDRTTAVIFTHYWLWKEGRTDSFFTHDEMAEALLKGGIEAEWERMRKPLDVFAHERRPRCYSETN